MDIMAMGARGWGFGMMSDGFKYGIDKKTGALSLVVNPKAKYKRDFVQVTTPHNVFLETLNEDGEVIQEGGDGDWYYVRLGTRPVTLRYMVLPDPEMTKAQIEKVRGKTTVTVAAQEQHDSGPMNFGASYTDGSLLAVIASFQKALASIPEEYRKNARCEIDSKGGYEGSHSAAIEITYARPETDKEVIERVKIERQRAKLAERAKRQKLAALKAELEPNG